jgi:hypothetical protein
VLISTGYGELAILEDHPNEPIRSADELFSCGSSYATIGRVGFGKNGVSKLKQKSKKKQEKSEA